MDVKINLTEEQKKLLNHNAKTVRVNGNTYYYLPFWFKDNKDGTFNMYHLEEKLPTELVSVINGERG